MSSSSNMLNYVLLIICIAVILGTLLYLFFFNRLLGFIIGAAFRFSFWSQGESSVWLDIGSIHFSILSGRILFKDLRYHSSNQTIKVVKGQLSWRYWIRRPTEEDDLSHTRIFGEDVNPKLNDPLACRVHMSLQGLEWFIYNRTAAYDYIFSQMEGHSLNTPDPADVGISGDGRSSLRNIFSRTSNIQEASVVGRSTSLRSSLYQKAPGVVKNGVAWLKRQLPALDPKDILPVSIEVTKAAFICGNASTPSLLVADFSKAHGNYGIVQSRSKYDLYKSMLNLKFQNASIRYVENMKYQESMVNTGEKVYNHIKTAQHLPIRRFSYLSFSAFQKLWRRMKLRDLVTWTNTRSTHISIPHPPASWRRKANKGMEDDTPVGLDYSKVEYAIERDILESPSLELLYYADVAGVVPSHNKSLDAAGVDPYDIGNRDLPPEWGLDLLIRGGIVRYGPWADRQRTHLQHTFFPPAYHDGTPRERLKPGDTRVWTSFDIFVELRDGVTLQVPFREASKNWQWDGQVEVPGRPRKREAAYIHMKAGDKSTIRYITPMVPSPKGYEPVLDVQLDAVVVSSSLNDIRLITADACRIYGDMPSPLPWNEKRQWKFVISLTQPSIYLLRDHINMLSDLGRDWSAGPPSDYYKFVPMVYTVELDLGQYDISLYVNDHNIIDKPLIREDNALLILRGTRARVGIQILSTDYRPQASTVSFWAEMPGVDISLTLPRWNVHSMYSTPNANNSNIARIGLFRLDGSYRYFADVRSDNVDHLQLNMEIKDIIYKAFGWTVRHFMIFRDNYFGSFTHFSTLSEYLDKRRKGQPVGDPIDQQYRPGHSNALQVELLVGIEYGLIVAPAALPGYEAHGAGQSSSSGDLDFGAAVLLSIPSLQLLLRTNDYFMELSVNIDTVSVRVEDHCYDKFLSTNMGGRHSHEAFVVDGIDIVGNRLFGPQPHTSTYVCIWEIHVGDVKGVLSASKGRILSAAGTAFGLNYTDSLNAPAAEYVVPADPDVTFLKVSLDSLNIIWLSGHAAAELSMTRGLRIDNNNLAGKHHRKVTSIRVPDTTVKLLLNSPMSPHTWHEAMYISLDANMDIYSAPPRWLDEARAQTQFIADQDRLTARACFLYTVDDTYDMMATGRGILDNDLYLPQLRIPKHPGADKTGVNRENGISGGTKRKAGGNNVYPLPFRSAPQSDSDGEEGVSEADRDARLANSKPNMASLFKDDDASTSSGDESDNEDLSDGDDSASDSTGTIDSATDLASWPSVEKYKKLSRSYFARYLYQPCTWEGSPFSLTKARLPRTWHFHRKHPVNEDISWENVPGLYHPPNPGEDTTVYRLLSRKGINIWITALVLPVAERLMKDFSINQLSPELRFDAIMASHLSSPDWQWNAKPAQRMIVFDARLSMQLKSPQSILVISEDLTVPSVPDAPGAVPRTEDVSVIDISLDALHLHGSAEQNKQSATRTTATFSFAQFCASLQAEQDGKNLHRDKSSRATFDLVLGRSRGSAFADKITLALGNVAVEMDHATPTYALATAEEIGKYGTGLFNAYQDLIVHTPAMDQTIIYQVLRYSRHRSIIDPLSTIQPSFLVQSGRPQELRTDLTFKFVFYLRNCLRYLEASERRAVLDSQPDPGSSIPLADVLRTLETQLLNLTADDDISSLAQQKLLRTLFPSDEPLPIPSIADYSQTVVFELQKAAMLIRHGPDMSRSDFILGPLKLLACIQPLNVMHAGSLYPSKSFANLSLREKASSKMSQIVVSLSLDEVGTTVSPQLMRFVQLVMRVSRHHSALSTSSRTLHASKKDRPTTARWNLLPISHITISLSTHSVRLTAAAANLIVEYRANQVTYASTMLVKKLGDLGDQVDLSMNHSVTSRQTSLKAYSTISTFKPSKPVMLAGITLTGGMIDVVLRQEPQMAPTIRSVFGLNDLHFSVPRSAIRLYRFAEEWRADYLPGINATIHDLLLELDNKPGGKSPIPSNPSPEIRKRSIHPIFTVHISISSIRVSLQIMHGTWLSWHVGKTATYMTSSGSTRHQEVQDFGLQIVSQTFSVSYRLKTSEDVVPRVKLELPSVSITGHRDETGFSYLALIEFFHVTIKPSHWDTLLSVQQKFGNDFNDLILLIEETQRRKAPSPKQKSHSFMSNRLRGQLRMKGFLVGLEGLSSTLCLACEDIGGEISNNQGLSWQINLSDLTLSLVPRSEVSIHSSSFDRDRCSAFVNIDFQAKMSSVSREKLFNVSVTKVHAVMQPSSIGELGDYVDNLQAEVSIRKEQRANDLASFKEKTRSVMRSLEVKVAEQRQEPTSWLDQHIINLSIKNIGVVFPLTLHQDLHVPRMGNSISAVRAFLFSVKSLAFDTHRGENGKAAMVGFSFQFVPRFIQSIPAHFSGENHRTRSSLLYPEMTAHVRSERSNGFRRLRIGADVSGFILDLDPSLPDYVGSLIDVYRQGKERVERLAGTIPHTPVVSDIGPLSTGTPSQVKSNVTPTSNVLVSLVFASGKVRMFSMECNNTRTRSISTTLHESSDDMSELGAEVFHVPVVSVWGEYRATPTSHQIPGNIAETSSTLLFKSTIHSSQNTLRPTVLPFLTEMITKFEDNMRKPSARNAQPASSQDHLHPTTASSMLSAVKKSTEVGTQPISSMQISFNLRIDQSKLELTCQPDANVIAGLHWDSGGFNINITPGARSVTFSGNVGGLTAGLKHGFLSEDCVKLDARNLVFSMNFSKILNNSGNVMSLVSVILDTEFSGIARFSRLQDVLCFKAVWLDRIPIFNAATPSHVPSKSVSHTISTVSATQEFTTAILLRLRHVELDIDLGQSICSVKLMLDEAVIRTRMTKIASELSLSVAQFAILATGNISGKASVPDFRFQTKRRTDGIPADPKGSRMLDLAMTSGPLHVELDSDYHRLIKYQAEPLEIMIYDDWSTTSSEVAEEDRRVHLTFSVIGSGVIAIMNVGTIPKLVSYVNKFKVNLEAQKEGASRESQAFRISSSPKPDNALSAVANAMISSARTRLKETGTGISYVIGQRMSLKLRLLQLVVFPRAMRDSELAQFIGRDIHARLDRFIETDATPAKRDLHLSFSSMTISKISQLNHSLVTAEQPTECSQWLTALVKDAPEATIFGLPSMDMRMRSEEHTIELTRSLRYKFSSTFSNKEGVTNSEDVYISLNMSLYSWLTILRKSFAREMEQAYTSADARLSSTVFIQPTVRRRGIEPNAVTSGIEKDRPPSTQIAAEHPDPKRPTARISVTIPAKSFPPLTHPSGNILDGELHSSPSTTLSRNKPFSHGGTVATASDAPIASSSTLISKKSLGITYIPLSRHIERLTMRQLGEATPDVMHPFFMKKAGFNLEDSLPQYVHEYATMPTEEIMKALLKLYSKQLSV